MKDKLLQKIASADLTQYSETLAEINLPKEERKQVIEAFETAVKGVSMKVTEELVEEAESDMEAYAEYIKEEVSAKAEAYGEYLKEEYADQIDTYLNHLAESWLQDNELAVTSGIKECMFDSLMGEFKTMFVEHNIYVPEDKVDVVGELEEQLTEYTAELDKTLRTNKDLNERVNQLEKVAVISEKTSTLTESQKERVETLSEKLEFTATDFDKQLDTIISMVSVGSKQIKEAVKPTINTNVKQIKESKGLNVSSYVNAARRLR